MTIRVGELRPNQLLHTYGVGAVADLPNLSVILMGLDFWDLAQARILTEDRLLAAVRRKLGPQVETLRTPPYTPEEGNDVFGDWTRVGVPVAAFPRYLRCTDGRCNRLASIDSRLFDLVPSAYSPDKVRYVHGCRGNGNRRPLAVPARFVLACTTDGHLDDFPWSYYVHRGHVPEGGDHTLQLVERGTSGEAANVFVVCSCDVSRPMAEAIGQAGERNLPACRGRHPHLGTFETCGQPTRTLALGATNGWFAMQMRVFSLPKADDELDQLVADHWDALGLLAALDEHTAKSFMPTQRCWPELAVYGADAVWAAIQRHTSRDDDSADDEDELDLASPEWAAFIKDDDVELPDFTTKRVRTPQRERSWLQHVTLVPRLREVSALYGFTRIDAPEWDVVRTDDRRRARLSREDPTWVPCAEMRGEGIFLRFKEERVAEWERLPEVREREKILREGHERWRAARRLEPGGWPGIRYLMLHTFAHVLIREFALESGYNATGISERVYARGGENPMAGVLLYTAAPDSEGTLGGLVSLGHPDRLGPLIRQAFDATRLCSSDPLCSEHDPRDHERLYGAACHACLFAAETSCERGNHYLDRALVVETLIGGEYGFFT
ncbi:protein of unknown function [Thermomonospora echinospora]|uniref:MrfA-like Zn-binding domain-containing protein n=1 Tax=Thermomonospora echinospora TaxID=1992 RepID=A0A1H5T5Q0_9ACTN|nr:DUF1998 domain-containing protein [Thermomonospora echinospora]SEF58192.1 protein of unknown function [Thermomonospora echinospora]